MAQHGEKENLDLSVHTSVRVLTRARQYSGHSASPASALGTNIPSLVGSPIWKGANKPSSKHTPEVDGQQPKQQTLSLVPLAWHAPLGRVTRLATPHLGALTTAPT